MSPEFDWRVYGSILMIIIIGILFLIPSKASRENKLLLQKQEARKAANNSNDIITSVGIMDVRATRGNSVTIITNPTGERTIEFKGIVSGHYSETVYLHLDGKGVITTYRTEALAQSAFKKGDYGILAVTRSPGVLIQRHIVPEIVHSDNAFSLELSLQRITK